IESLSISNKRFVFRIVQSFIHLLSENISILILTIKVVYHSSIVEILFTMNNKDIVINKTGSQFQDIIYRVDYFEGTIEEYSNEKEKIVKIVFSILN
ncbi:MAG: hypothetical protein ABUT20_31735, partial [Bacteroidota bacterium]